jgi:hypothetical protein
MTNNTATEHQRTAPPNPESYWVHEVLEPDQLSTAKQPFGRQPLSRKTKILLWGLRVYVVLMVLLVVLQTWNAFHTAR